MMLRMYEVAIAAGALLLLAFAIMAARGKMTRDTVAVPAAATANCVGCGTTVGPGEGGRFRGEMYCGNGCARWAW